MGSRRRPEYHGNVLGGFEVGYVLVGIVCYYLGLITVSLLVASREKNERRTKNETRRKNND